MATTGNPLVAQGTLNRVLGSITFSDFPSLNVTAPYLGREGIRMTLQGDATVPFGTMTGAVMAPEVYQLVEVRMMLLKTQGLAAAWKSQYETSTLIGDCTVYPDVSTGIPTYSFTNAAIRSNPNLEFDASNPDFPVVLIAYYNINSNLFS